MTKARQDVRSVLSDRPLIVLRPEETVREAAAILCSQEIGAAPVLADDRLVGIFSERDVLQRVVAAGRDANATRVQDVMTPDPSTIGADCSLVKAFGMMIEGRFRHLPVVEGGRVVAILSMRDVPPEYRIMHRQWTEWTNGKAVPQTLS